MEIEAERENDAILNALAGDVDRMKREAGDLKDEVTQHNVMLEAIGKSLTGAVSGVRGTITRLADVMKKNTCKGQMMMALGIFAVFLFVYYLWRSRSSSTTPAPA